MCSLRAAGFFATMKVHSVASLSPHFLQPARNYEGDLALYTEDYSTIQSIGCLRLLLQATSYGGDLIGERRRSAK